MYVAVDVGGTKTLVALFDEAGACVKSQEIPTSHDYDTFVQNTITQISDIMEGQDVQAIAIAMPGPIDYAKSEVISFGNIDWENVDIAARLKDHFKLPIIIDNDANLAALGEANLGAGKGKRLVLYVTFSTGIGTGVTVDGKLDPALRSSEGGQMLLEHDGEEVRWETFASGKAFFKRYGKPGSEIDDPKIWQEYARDMALGLWELNTMIQPDIIVIGGSMGVHFAKYEQFLNDELKQFDAAVVGHPNIVQAQDPVNAVINGCFVAAKDYARNNS